MEKETCIKCGSMLYYDMRKINIKDKGIAIKALKQIPVQTQNQQVVKEW